MLRRICRILKNGGFLLFCEDDDETTWQMIIMSTAFDTLTCIDFLSTGFARRLVFSLMFLFQCASNRIFSAWNTLVLSLSSLRSWLFYRNIVLSLYLAVFVVILLCLLWFLLPFISCCLWYLVVFGIFLSFLSCWEGNSFICEFVRIPLTGLGPALQALNLCYLRYRVSFLWRCLSYCWIA